MMQMIIALVKRDNLARHVCATDVVAIQLVNQPTIRWLRGCSECHMTDISFLTESVTEEERCCKEIVGIDLPECCLGTEFNLLTAAAYYEGVLDVAGASRVTAPRALALSHTPKIRRRTPRWRTPPTSLPPRRRPPRRWPPRWRGSAGAQEPEPAASPPKAGGKGGVRARGGGK